MIKQFIFTMLACVCFQVMAFGQEEKQQNNKEKKELTYVTLPINDDVRFKSKKKRVENMPESKNFGRFRLEFNGTDYSQSIENLGYEEEIRGIIPNAISFTTFPLYKGISIEELSKIHKRIPHGCYKIEFYDATVNSLIKSIDLIESSPYKDIISDLNNDIPNIEGFKIEDNKQKKGLKPKKFYSDTRIFSPGTNYVLLDFRLTGTLGNKIVSWEETLNVLDKNGNTLKSVHFNHNLTDAFISADGRFLIVLFGGIASLEPFSDGQTLEIIDLDTNEVIYEEKNCNYLGLSEIAPDFIIVGSQNENSEIDFQKIECFLLPQRIKFYKTLTKENYEKYILNQDNYHLLFNNLPFYQLKY